MLVIDGFTGSVREVNRLEPRLRTLTHVNASVFTALIEFPPNPHTVTYGR